jgi:hypothetical protein
VSDVTCRSTTPLFPRTTFLRFTAHFPGWSGAQAAVRVDPYEAKLAAMRAAREQASAPAGGDAADAKAASRAAAIAKLEAERAAKGK